MSRPSTPMLEMKGPRKSTNSFILKQLQGNTFCFPVDMQVVDCRIWNHVERNGIQMTQWSVRWGMSELSVRPQQYGDHLVGCILWLNTFKQPTGHLFKMFSQSLGFLTACLRLHPPFYRIPWTVLAFKGF